jgi:phosphonate transport system substrate-binding protein
MTPLQTKLSRRGVLRSTGGLAVALAAASAGGALVSCGGASGPAVGTTTRPLEMAFIPSSDTQKILASGKPLADLLEKETGLKINTNVPTAYAPLIEAMGAEKVDVGWLAPFSYAVAHKNNGAEAILATVRQGSKTYVSEFITQSDSGIKKLEDLKGKRFAFGDPLSSSNYLYPAAEIKQKFGLDPEKFFSEVKFAGGHDKVVIAVYNRQVDAGATFGNSTPNGPETAARTTVVNTLPDVLTKVTKFYETEPIPNDTVSVRKGLPKDVTEKVKNGLLKLAGTADGKKLLKDLYQIDGLAAASDADYAPLRKKAELMNLDLEVAAKIKPAPTATTAK